MTKRNALILSNYNKICLIGLDVRMTGSLLSFLPAKAGKASETVPGAELR